METKSPSQTRQAAGRIVRALLRSQRYPLILALSGELGSGKTTFIQGLAETLGIREKVQSPTFVLMKIYAIKEKPFRNFIHLDAYRIGKPQELLALGFRDIVRDPQNLVVIEWAERIRELVPRGAKWVKFSHGRKSNERVITINE